MTRSAVLGLGTVAILAIPASIPTSGDRRVPPRPHLAAVLECPLFRPFWLPPMSAREVTMWARLVPVLAILSTPASAQDYIPPWASCPIGHGPRFDRLDLIT